MNKHIKILVLLLTTNTLHAQEVNWRTVDENTTHLFSVVMGADYSSYYGVSYGLPVKTNFALLIVGTELTLPFGDEVVDDWRWRTSIQSEVWKKDHFTIGLKPGIAVRRYESPMARLLNIGAEMTLTYGYVRPKWGIVGITSYDKSMATHIKHGTLKEYYPEITDGWFGAAGGNYKFGVRAHVTCKDWNTFLTVGKHFGQDFQDNPTLPFFAELTVQRLVKR